MMMSARFVYKFSIMVCLTTCNITNIILIPKVSKATNLSNFRQISLCTVLYKIISKTVANRFV